MQIYFFISFAKQIAADYSFFTGALADLSIELNLWLKTDRASY